MRGGQLDQLGIVADEESRNGLSERDDQPAHDGQHGKRSAQADLHQLAQAVEAARAAVEAGDGLQAVGCAEAQDVQEVDDVAVDHGERGEVGIAAQRSQIVVDRDGVHEAGCLHQEQRQALPEDRAAYRRIQLHASERQLEGGLLVELEVQNGEEPQPRAHAVVRARGGEAQVEHVHAQIQP